MSAFVCNYGVIDDVVFIMNKDPDDEPPRSDEQRIADGTTLGRLLIDMNQHAVSYRYEEPRDEADKLYVRNYEYVEPNGVPGVQKYKSIGCFTYQCCEGPVPEWELFKRTYGYEEMLEPVFRGTPAYDKAKWNRGRE